MEQVLPEAPEKALNTIHGVVRVTVRVHVDAAGNVSQAELEAPGPSRYFADLALKAAGKWVFGSPELEGRSVASEWLIRFEYYTIGRRGDASADHAVRHSSPAWTSRETLKIAEEPG